MKKKTFLYIFLLVLCLCLAIFIHWNREDKTFTTALILITTIPIIATFIPLIQELRKMFREKRNQISNITFTDRKQDLNNIFDTLRSSYIIQISGEESKSGKTWIIKKTCDFVNHVNHRKAYLDKKFKCKYKTAHYIDMETCPEPCLQNFFNENHKNKKTLLIFDHIQDLSEILTKQTEYKFGLLYVLKEKGNNANCVYKISEFEEKHINELQCKIIQIHPKIDKLEKDEISILYDLTDGNIGKIHTILSSNEYVEWVKKIHMQESTDYDVALNKISIELFTGEYLKGNDKLALFKDRFRSEIHLNNDINFKYTIIKSDCEHLLNNYKKAVLIIETLDRKSPYNNNFKVELQLAHYYKHLWRNEEALELLKSIYKENFSSVLDSFGIYMAQYFINDDIGKNCGLSEFKHLYEIAKNNIECMVLDKNSLKMLRYQLYYDFYTQTQKPTTEKHLIESANKLIQSYKDTNNRLLANMYVLRGELYRLFSKYNLADSDYEQSLLVTTDNNIKSQVDLIRYYLFSIKEIRIKPKFQVLTKQELIKQIEHNNYCKKLFRRINSIELNDGNKSAIIKSIESKIMSIL